MFPLFFLPCGQGICGLPAGDKCIMLIRYFYYWVYRKEIIMEKLQRQLDFLKKASDEEFMSFGAENYLLPLAEVFLLNSGDEVKVKFYLRRYYLSPEAEELLFRIGNDEWIEIYLTGMEIPLSDRIEPLFVQWADDERLKAYDEKFGLCPEVKQLRSAV